MTISYTRETMRKTILGEITWVACPLCSGTGFQNWDEDGNDIKSGRTGDDSRCNGECENCEGLGFIHRT